MWSGRTSNRRRLHKLDMERRRRARAVIAWRACRRRATLLVMRRGSMYHFVVALLALLAALASPAMALAHGFAHAPPSEAHDHGVGTLAHEGHTDLALEPADHDAGHSALHVRDEVKRSPGKTLVAPVVAARLAPAPLVQCAVLPAPATHPPPSRLAAPDQPRAPPRG